MVPSYLLGSLNVARSPSLQSFSSYKQSEVHNLVKSSVSCDGKLLEYETLELRVHPPNIEIDNESVDDATVITVDSANRPGTLIEVVQVLTELGLLIKKARISSDGGWFVDVFHITEASGAKVRDERKLDTIRKMLNVDFDNGSEGDDGTEDDRVSTATATVFELAGQDRPRLLSDITHLLTVHGLDVKSAAVWTYCQRAAFVLSVTENGLPVQTSSKRHQLQRQLFRMMDGAGWKAIVNIRNANGRVHFERRLHKLLLMEEDCRYQSERRPYLLMGQLPSVSEAEDNSCAASTSPSAVVAGESGSSTPAASSPTCPMFRSPKHSRPDIEVCLEDTGYWMVTIKCKDRNKLLFDSVCTLADLDYDIYHASIDSESSIATQEYYVRPRLFSGFDQERARKLKYLLEASIQRRFPEGMKLHVQAVEQFGCLARLTKVLADNNLTITRAKARSLGPKHPFGHTFYVMDMSGVPPTRSQVETACNTIGGRLVESIEETDLPDKMVPALDEGHQFSFSFLQRHWHREWAGSPSSSVGSS